MFNPNINECVTHNKPIEHQIKYFQTDRILDNSFSTEVVIPISSKADYSAI